MWRRQLRRSRGARSGRHLAAPAALRARFLPEQGSPVQGERRGASVAMSSTLASVPLASAVVQRCAGPGRTALFTLRAPAARPVCPLGASRSPPAKSLQRRPARLGSPKIELRAAGARATASFEGGGAESPAPESSSQDIPRPRQAAARRTEGSVEPPHHRASYELSRWRVLPCPDALQGVRYRPERKRTRSGSERSELATERARGGTETISPRPPFVASHPKPKPAALVPTAVPGRSRRQGPPANATARCSGGSPNPCPPWRRC